MAKLPPSYMDTMHLMNPGAYLLSADGGHPSYRFQGFIYRWGVGDDLGEFPLGFKIGWWRMERDPSYVPPPGAADRALVKFLAEAPVFLYLTVLLLGILALLFGVAAFTSLRNGQFQGYALLLVYLLTLVAITAHVTRMIVHRRKS